ncbi:hypothetical protein MRX96_048541 [Rhipicephalus microplus]
MNQAAPGEAEVRKKQAEEANTGSGPSHRFAKACAQHRTSTKTRRGAEKERGLPLNFKDSSATPLPPSPLGGKKAPSTTLSRSERSSRHRKRGGSRARAAVAARELDSSSSESTSPEYKHHAPTAVVGDDSLSTTLEDSEMD